MVVGATVALVAGCSGGGDEVTRSEPAPSAAARVTPGADPVGSTAATGRPAPPPTARPTGTPTQEPTQRPTQRPTARPTGRPTGTPPAERPGPPVIGRVWTTPQLPCDAGTCTLSPPAGTVTFHAAVRGATSVEVSLVSTGTGPDRDRRVLGVDRNGRDGWTVGFTYADEPLLGHLAVVARGPGGRADEIPFKLHHPDPTVPADPSPVDGFVPLGP